MWDLAEVSRAIEVDNTSFSCTPEHQFEGFSTDNRTDLRNRVFVPLVGDTFDGHDYAAKAVQSGALATLWARPGGLPDGLEESKVFRCSDTLEALQMLGRYHLRQHCPCRVIGITGSTGKTLTKDLLAALLSTKWNVAKTPGNYNNDVGLPLTLLSLNSSHQIVVLEMGMRGLGQIRRLAQLVDPEVGIITNIGVSHIELLGSRAAIAQAKGELLECLVPSGVAVLPLHCDFLEALSQRAPGRSIQTFSSQPNPKADAAPADLENLGLDGWNFTLPDGFRCHLPIPGPHLLEDFMAAWLAAQQFGIDSSKLNELLATGQWSQGRLEQHRYPDGTVVLNDAYNAAPDSMRGALEVLSFAKGPKLAVLGDMLELGPQEQSFHEQVGQWVSDFGVERLLAVGRRAKWLADAATQAGVAQVSWVASTEEAQGALASMHRPGDTVLLKASRGMGLDRLMSVFEKSEVRS
jgi:UDP-N-acetylmuramoyl-tripeptide--D-alanyl-D-alanine ligase